MSFTVGMPQWFCCCCCWTKRRFIRNVSLSSNNWIFTNS